MSKLDGVLIFLLGIPVTLMAWISMSEAEGYYMSEAINQGFPMGIAFIALIGAMGLTMLMVGLFISHINRNN
jgi:hypothetical protein